MMLVLFILIVNLVLMILLTNAVGVQLMYFIKTEQLLENNVLATIMMVLKILSFVTESTLLKLVSLSLQLLLPLLLDLLVRLDLLDLLLPLLLLLLLTTKNSNVIPKILPVKNLKLVMIT